MKATKQRRRAGTPTAARAASVALACCALSCQAATLVTSAADGGGASGAGACANDGCLGCWSGVSAAGATVVRHGFAGQLAEPLRVSLRGEPAVLDEGATSRLSGAATLTDDSVTALTGEDIAWDHCAYPLDSIDPTGLATAALVYSNTSATVSGAYLGVPGTGTLDVLDTWPDNYGLYAGDGVPDGWQCRYFGLNNADALAASDPDGDEQDNLHEWMALTVPTDAASQFQLRIENVSGHADQKRLVFGPRLEERTYMPLYVTDLAGHVPWSPLTAATTADAGDERHVTDTNATSQAKFYRIQIGLP